MPWLVSVLIGGLLTTATSFVGRVILSLAFGFVEYIGISTLVNKVISESKGLIDSVGASALSEWAGFMRVDIHISIIISAIGVKLLLNSLNSDSVKKMVQK